MVTNEVLNIKNIRARQLRQSLKYKNGFGCFEMLFWKERLLFLGKNCQRSISLRLTRGCRALKKRWNLLPSFLPEKRITKILVKNVISCFDFSFFVRLVRTILTQCPSLLKLLTRLTLRTRLMLRFRLNFQNFLFTTLITFSLDNTAYYFLALLL